MLKTKVLFVCLGNICRSPMAEFVLRDLAQQAGCAQMVETASAGTSGWHNGEDMHAGTRAELVVHHILPNGFVSSQVRASDADDYDYIVAMDDHNMAELARLFGPSRLHRVHKLTDWLGNCQYDHVPDPYFTGDFRETWHIVSGACSALLADIQTRCQSR